MLKKSELKRRDSYLNKLIAFRDTEPVKVITGIRGCGKQSLLKLMVNYLKDSGVDESQIIEMNFESFEFRRMTVEDFYFLVFYAISFSFVLFAIYLQIHHLQRNWNLLNR